MAASRRDSSMRDQRRVDDEYRNREDHRHRNAHRGRRSKSPAPTRSGRVSDEGLKIRGRAIDEEPAQPRSLSTRIEDPRDRGRERHRDHSLYREARREQGVESARKSSLSRSQFRSRPERYRESDLRQDKRRSRSRSPLRPTKKEGGKRTISPKPVTFRERRVSPLQTARERQYYPDEVRHRDGPPVDSYAPSRRHRSRSLRRTDLYKPPEPGKALSPSRRHRDRQLSPEYTRGSYREHRKYEEDRRTSRLSTEPTGRPNDTSPRETRNDRYRRPSRSPHREEHRAGKRRRSPSRGSTHRVRKSEERGIHTSGRPLYSTSGRNSRQSSPPRSIPNFDGPQRGPNSETLTKSMQDPYAAQRHRPPQVDTRQPYNTSPQWTPTSSHHGSPHGASPYHHGRGSWSQQPPPQQYYGQLP